MGWGSHNEKMASSSKIPQPKHLVMKQTHAQAQAVTQLLQQGFSLHQQGELARAKKIYTQLLEGQPDHFDALHLLGVIAIQSRNPTLAADLIGKALVIKPGNAVAQSNRGNALLELKRPEEALTSYDKAIALKSDYAEAIYNRGNALQELKRLEEALASYDKAIALKPDYAEAFTNRGNALKELNREEEALASYDKAIKIASAIEPDYAEAHYNYGRALQELNRLEEALASYDKAIAIKPDYAQAFSDRGNALNGLNRAEEALASYDKAIAIRPDFAAAFNNRGVALQALKRLSDAVASYDKAIDFKPDYVEAFNNRGITLQQLKRQEEALASYDKAITIKPDYADAYINRGNALTDLKKQEEALASYDKAIALKPNYAEAHINRGVALELLMRQEEALASYDKAIDSRPDFVEALSNRAKTLHVLNRVDEALASYDKAIAIKPDHEFLLGSKLHMKMYLCDWSDLSNQLHQLESALADAYKVVSPFELLGLIDNPALQLQASKIYADALYPASDNLNVVKKRAPDGKIRIGYYSADFRDHVVSELIIGLFEQHDSDRFEVYGFSFGPPSSDDVRKRIYNTLDHFIDIETKSDNEVAQMSRILGIDIAIDLGGFTKNSRLGIFAARCAPIQVNYIGYPGTMGAAYMDYIVADKTLIPHVSQQYYTEKIVYLPNSFQVNDSKRKISEKVFTRQEVGLPEIGFVFCCFNNNSKILPATFDGWLRLLKSVKGSVLWLYADQPTAVKNLKKEAEIRGVNPNRLVFARREKGDAHRARHRVADLFLDTLPFNAGATASTALWSGLPLLTLIGESFTARYAASLLHAMDLPELITETQAQYEARAIELANDPAELAEIRAKLHRNLQTSTLFNGELFARHIEAAYEEMYRRYLSDEKLDHIYVNP
jgi:protein O-GlcNAc transferase